MNGDLLGRIHSFQKLGAVDGPGLRFVVFMQGCPLRCGCCHNPDTWTFDDGKDYYVSDIVEDVKRYKPYFGKNGGITISGGEPLMQPQFVARVFELCHENGINTCLDTSGCTLNERTEDILKHTDRILLDVKYTTTELYLQHVGCTLEGVMRFLARTNALAIPVTIRQVIIPTLNDNDDNIEKLNGIARRFSCVDGIELLPFKKICETKYAELGIEFPFANYPAADSECIKRLSRKLIFSKEQ